MILLLKYKVNNVYWLWYVFVKWKKYLFGCNWCDIGI